MPEELQFLETLCYNMWWCWNSNAVELFRRIDPDKWREANHNPLRFFTLIPQERLEELAADNAFVAHYNEVKERFFQEIPDAGMGCLPAQKDSVAYFSLEYGIHESVRLYSGGLGCLAGDHLKAASGMRIPLVGVGVMYRCGYFKQYLNADGWQQEAYPENEIHRLPLKKACTDENKQVRVTLPLPDGQLHATVWELDVGRVPLFLLDANIPENPPELRRVSSQLYEVDKQLRLRQELLLGIGGMKALVQLGYDPPSCHMNEGHAGFVVMGKISHLMKDKGYTFEQAFEIVRRTAVFTTHTPVPAGNETFDRELVKNHLSAMKDDLGIDPETALRWGMPPGQPDGHAFTMTILGLRLSRFSNAVSQLHGRVTRSMWSHLWPGRPEDEIPLTHVTNGVHLASWLSPENAALFDRYVGNEWRIRPSDEKSVSRIDQVPDVELWRAHEMSRSRLIRTARVRGERQFSARHATSAEIARIRSVLNHNTLTLGFARRFATYKRANLLLRDPERLKAILTNEKMPVQLVFGGKAHPADEQGKKLIQDIVRFARQEDIRDRIIFLENYDIQLARYFVQGVDVWVNTPRRPHEASGTSGMKAALNGVLNASILDGWWAEGYSPECGWAIGNGEEYSNEDYQDTVESHALYNLLENEIVPVFYQRNDDDVPVEWVRRMKGSMKMSMSFYTSRRMLQEYNENLYSNAVKEAATLGENGAKRVKKLVSQHKRLSEHWHEVNVSSPEPDRDISVLHVGDRFKVTAEVHLGKLQPEEVDVEVYYGPVNPENNITESLAEKMQQTSDEGDGKYLYSCEISCKTTGRYGLTARATPAGKEWSYTIPGFITWANGY
jgi:starch phosphorylase